MGFSPQTLFKSAQNLRHRLPDKLRKTEVFRTHAIEADAATSPDVMLEENFDRNINKNFEIV
jgi:hypothetical protein